MGSEETRLKEQVGIVTGEATVNRFSFFVTPLANKTGVEKEDYVLIDHPFLGESCPILAIVKKLRNYEEVVGTAIRENGTIKAMAIAEIVGCVDIRKPEAKYLRGLAIPPKPGSRVYLPYLEFLEDVFSRTYGGKTFEHPIYIGELESYVNSRDGRLRHLNFYFDSTDLSTHHMLISGISGSGKTHAAIVIVEELINKTGLPLVILDPYSEYATIGVQESNFNQLTAEGRIESDDYPFNFESMVYAFDDKSLLSNLERSGIDTGQKNRLVVQHSSNLFSETSEKRARFFKDRLKLEVGRNRALILDSKGMLKEDAQRFFNSCLQALLSNRFNKEIEPFLLIVEEAAGLETELLRRVASEGRRLGITMCLLTQHPTEIDGRVLSQMGTYLIGRTSDTRDIECLKNIAADKSSLMPHLRPGEWIVNSSNLNRPVKVVARERYSKKI